MSNNVRNILLNLIAAVIQAALAYMFSFLCPDMRDDLRVLIAILVAIVGLLSWHHIISPRFRLFTQRLDQKKPAYIKQAVVALDSASHADRKAAVETLAQADHLAAREALAGAVQHPIQDVRIHAAFKLAQQFKDPRAVPGLIEVLRGEYSYAGAEERRLAAALLGEIGEAAQSGVPALLDVLRDDIQPIRVNVAWALGQIGDDTAVPGLIDALRDRERDVRKVAAIALGQLRNVNAVPALIDALRDGEGSVRQAAAEALRRIGTPEALSATATTKY